MKLLLIKVLLFAFVLINCKTNEVVKNKKNTQRGIPFNWVETEIDGKKYAKSAMTIKFDLLDGNEIAEFQFDTGSQQSFVSAETFDFIIEKYPGLVSSIDTLKYDETNSDIVLKELMIKSGSEELVINLYKGESDGVKLDQDNYEITGTIGADFCTDKIIIIDYPNQRIDFKSELPGELYHDFVDTENVYGKLNVPIEIQEEVKYVLFDTGASIFELATTPAGYKSICGSLEFTQDIQVPSFGTMLLFKGKKSNKKIKVAGKTINDPFIHFSENTKVISFLEESNLFGVIGNSLFIDNIVVLDYIKGKFGILDHAVYRNDNK